MLVRLVIAALLLAAVAVVASGEDDTATGSDGRLTVVATTTQAADLARNAGGDGVEVVGLLAPNADPHDYEVRPRDLQALADADLVVRSGGDLDEWLQEAVEGAGSSARVLTLSDHVRTVRGDPHWWQDPRNAIAAVAAIERALGTDAARYTARLRALDRSVAACIAEIPVGERKLVTTHDALGYYARRYGLEVIGAVIPSRSTRGQPSAGETAELVRTIRAQGVGAIFAESSVNPKVERAIARETGATVGRPLWADTLGPAGSDGETYVDSIAANTRGARRRASPAAGPPARSMPEAFEAPFMQRALVESLLLAALAGVLGSWIVLRRLAFFTHGVGTAAFPGLVIAAPAGVAAAADRAGRRARLRRRGGGAAAPARGHRRGHRAGARRRPGPRRRARLRRLRDGRRRRPAAVREPDRAQRPRPVADGRCGVGGAGARGRRAPVVARPGLRSRRRRGRSACARRWPTRC